MSAVAEKKPRLTTSAMIASIASEGQKTRPAPFGHALVAKAEKRRNIVGMTADLSKYRTCTSSIRRSRNDTFRWAWPSSC